MNDATDDESNGLVLVVDIGSELIKAGFAGDAPSFVAHSYRVDPATGHMLPHRDGAAIDWNGMRELWQRTFAGVGVAPTAHKVFVVVPADETDDNLRRLADLLFSTFRVPRICFGDAALLTASAAAMRTGIIVESGASTTVVSAIADGTLVPKCHRTAPLAGAVVTRTLGALLERRNPQRVFSYEQLTAVKEAHASVDGGVPTSQQIATTQPPAFLNSEERGCGEVLFAPAVHGVTGDALQAVVVDVAQRAAAAVAVTGPATPPAAFLQNIVASGGTARLRGFPTRLAQEIRRLTGTATPDVHLASPAPELAAWRGAANMAYTAELPWLDPPKPAAATSPASAPQPWSSSAAAAPPASSVAVPRGQQCWVTPAREAVVGAAAAPASTASVGGGGGPPLPRRHEARSAASTPLSVLSGGAPSQLQPRGGAGVGTPILAAHNSAHGSGVASLHGSGVGSGLGAPPSPSSFGGGVAMLTPRKTHPRPPHLSVPDAPSAPAAIGTPNNKVMYFTVPPDSSAGGIERASGRFDVSPDRPGYLYPAVNAVASTGWGSTPARGSSHAGTPGHDGMRMHYPGHATPQRGGGAATHPHPHDAPHAPYESTYFHTSPHGVPRGAHSGPSVAWGSPRTPTRHAPAPAVAYPQATAAAPPPPGVVSEYDHNRSVQAWKDKLEAHARRATVDASHKAYEHAQAASLWHDRADADAVRATQLEGRLKGLQDYMTHSGWVRTIQDLIKLHDPTSTATAEELLKHPKYAADPQQLFADLREVFNTRRAAQDVPSYNELLDEYRRRQPRRVVARTIRARATQELGMYFRSFKAYGEPPLLGECVVVSGVEPGSPAEMAGIHIGDGIMFINDVPIPDLATAEHEKERFYTRPCGLYDTKELEVVVSTFDVKRHDAQTARDRAAGEYARMVVLGMRNTGKGGDDDGDGKDEEKDDAKGDKDKDKDKKDKKDANDPDAKKEKKDKKDKKDGDGKKEKKDKKDGKDKKEKKDKKK